MKTLYCIRHAKSDRNPAHLSDFERPLNARGLKQARNMAVYFGQAEPHVDYFLSSQAYRARETAEIFKKNYHWPSTTLSFSDKMYLASAQQLLGEINRLPEHCRSAALFGHNPGITDIVNYLSDTEFFDMQTCSIAKITFEVDSWRYISGGLGRLVFHKCPEDVILSEPFD